MKRIIVRCRLAIITLLINIPMWAQSQLMRGGRALEQGAQAIKDNFVKPVITLAYVVALIMGIAGAVRVFKKMQDGDQDAAKSGGALLGAAIFLVIIIYIFQQFFLSDGVA